MLSFVTKQVLSTHLTLLYLSIKPNQSPFTTKILCVFVHFMCFSTFFSDKKHVEVIRKKILLFDSVWIYATLRKHGYLRFLSQKRICRKKVTEILSKS